MPTVPVPARRSRSSGRRLLSLRRQSDGKQPRCGDVARRDLRLWREVRRRQAQRLHLARRRPTLNARRQNRRQNRRQKSRRRDRTRRHDAARCGEGAAGACLCCATPARIAERIPPRRRPEIRRAHDPRAQALDFDAEHLGDELDAESRTRSGSLPSTQARASGSARWRSPIATASKAPTSASSGVGARVGTSASVGSSPTRSAIAQSLTQPDATVTRSFRMAQA